MDIENEEDDILKIEQDSANKYKKSIKKYESALSLEKPVQFAKILQIPGIVFFACIAGYTVGYMQVGYWVVVPLLYTVAYVFVRRIQEFKRGIEAYVYFTARKQTVSKYEKVDWMNAILEKTWRYVESNISKTLILKVNTALNDVKVPMIHDIKLEKFTLGGHPPIIEGIRVRHTDSESLVVDVSVSLVPAVWNEKAGDETHGHKTENGNENENKTEWNSNIELMARIGTSIAAMSVPFSLQNFMFKGNMRVKLNLTYETTLVEGVEFSFLKQPEVSFNLVPLQIGDMMDIPGLATAVKKVIETGVAKEALYPKKIVVSLKPKSVYYVGVIVVHIHKIASGIGEEYMVEVGLNERKGRIVEKTRETESCNIVAYIPVKNLDEVVCISLKETEQSLPIAMAQVKIEEICTKSRSQNIAPLSNGMGYIDVSASYLPKIEISKIADEDKPKSAIVAVKLIQLIDMVNHTGGTYKTLQVRITACMKEKKVPGKNPEHMTASELMPGEEKSTAPSATNESSTETDEEAANTAGANTQDNNTANSNAESSRAKYSGYRTNPIKDEVLGVHMSKIVRDMVSPALDETFVFYTRDTKRTTILVEALHNEEVIGSFTANIRRGVSISYGTFDFWRLSTGRAKLAFSAEYVCMHKVRMQKYTHVRKIIIQSIDLLSVYTGYVVTSGRVVSVRPFYSCGHGTEHGTVYVPVLKEEEKSKLVMYQNGEVFGGCDVTNGETYMGESLIKMSCEDIPIVEEKITSTHVKNAASIGSGDGNSTVSTSTGRTESTKDTSKIDPVGGVQPQTTQQSTQSANDAQVQSENTQDSRDTLKCMFIQMRVIVCRVNHPIFLEFSKDDMIIDRSAPSTGKKLCGEFVFYTDVSVSVYTMKERFLIGKFILSRNSGRHEIKLAHGQIFVIDVRNRWFASYAPKYISRCDMSVSVNEMRMSQSPSFEEFSRIFESVYLEVAVNDVHHQTEKCEDVVNPRFTDAFVFPVFVPLDILHIKVYGSTVVVQERKLMGQLSIPVRAISCGLSVLTLSVPFEHENNTEEAYKALVTINLQ